MWDRVRAVVLRLRALLRAGEVDRELDEELRFHLEMEAEKHLRQGLSPEAARREAYRSFGGVDRFKQQSREARGVQWLEDGVTDLRRGARALVKSPLFSGVAVLTLALGVGANTALFSVVDAVLLEPLPFDDPGRLTRVYTRNFKQSGDPYMVSPLEFKDWRDYNRAFEGLAAFWPTAVTLTGLEGGPARATAVYTTEDYFDVLGVTPLLGRTFTPQEGEGSAFVAVLTEGLWHRLLGGDEAVIGKALEVNGSPVEIVGVIPERSVYPEGADLWINMNWGLEIQARHTRWMSALGRMEDGATLEAAREDMTRVALRLTEENPDSNTGWTVHVESLVDEVVGNTRATLWVLLGATALILLIACANVANLLLSRSETRSREIAVRTAFGAGRTRLARQLLTESVLLASVGGLAGLLLGWAGLRGLLALAPPDLPRLDEVGLDGTVLWVALGVTLLTGLVFGMAPAARMLAGDLHAAINEGGRGSRGRHQTSLQRAFVVAQLALAVVLVTGAGLLVRSFERLRSVDIGFESSGLLTFELDVGPSSADLYPEIVTVYEAYLDALRRMQGVVTAGMTSSLPFVENVDYAQPVGLVGRAERSWDDPRRAYYRQVDAGFFEALRVPLLRGRMFSELDRWGAPGVVLVNETAARLYWPDEDPIGQRVTVVGGGYGPLGFIQLDTAEVVGVVKDVMYEELRKAPQPSIYMNHQQAPFRRMTVMIRTAEEPASLLSGSRRALADIDPSLAIGRVQTMSDVAARTRAPDRFAATVLAVFGGLALLLAAVGVYGVLAYSVAQRVPEVGIRMALGADARDVRRMILSDGARLAGFGIAVGLAGTLALSGVLSSQLFGVSPRDPAVLFSVATVLGAVAILASYLPARRATRIHPTEALRRG